MSATRLRYRKKPRSGPTPLDGEIPRRVRRAEPEAGEPLETHYVVRMAGEPRFLIGQVVHHVMFDYRGVIYDIDTEFSLSEQWYEQVALSRPPKDAPWYRVLVHNASHETYVAERNLEPDTSGNPVLHPLVTEYFDEFRGDHYARTRSSN